jgi:ArsR family transcriptional regulator, lead/cadmium/zinc/bismuth-responsive transcriptional repressor
VTTSRNNPPALARPHADRHAGRGIESPMPGEASLITLSEFFRVFGDMTRLRILYLLSRDDLCVHDIADRLEMNQSAISHQLRVLKQARLVKYRRDGRSICYSLDDDHVKQIFTHGLEHINE